MPNKIKIDEVMRRLPSFVKIVPETYRGMRYNADFVDIDYNEKFVANVHSVINLQHGCKSRSNDLRSKSNKERLSGKFGKDGAVSLEEVKSRLPYFLEIDESTYKGVRYKTRFYDKEYQTWFESYPANILKGRGSCKKRRYDNNKIKGIIPLEEVQQRLKDAFGDEYIILPETYKSISESAVFKKNNGDIFKSTVYNVISGKHKNRRELEKWKAKIFVRDNWICQRCGSINKTQAHHIRTFHSYPEGRFDPNNGITLCKDCHESYHALYKNEETVENFNLFLEQYSKP
jgi:hypothetical protein